MHKHLAKGKMDAFLKKNTNELHFPDSLCFK